MFWTVSSPFVSFDDAVTFDIQRSRKHPSHHDDTLYFIDTLMSHVGNFFREFSGTESEALVTHMLGGDFEVTDCELEEDPPVPSGETSVGSDYAEVLEVLERETPEEKPSVETPPSLELKELPSTLEYAFFGNT